MDSQKLALAQFKQQSFFLLTLPRGSEFGFDSKLFVVDKFSGVKFLPPGLHLFLFSAASTSKDSPATSSGGVGIRHGILRFFRAGQTIVEDWDNIQEELVSDRSIDTLRRRRGPLGEGMQGEEEIVVDQDRLKALDATLAAYPSDLAKEWNKLVSFITPTTLARVIGIDARGNARVDAVMGSTADEEELKAAGGRQTWGKERPDFVTDEGEVEADEPAGELLVFERVDLKRSWPPGAVGEELTRWSQDKSWLLSNTIKRLEPCGVQEFLAEMQLSFILYTLLHNFSALSIYKSLFSLLCRSTSILLPPSARPLSTASPYASSILTLESLPLYASFIQIFSDQLTFLDKEFFSVQMPGLDIFLLTELDFLLVTLSDASSHWNSIGGSGKEIWRVLVGRWDEMTRISTEKFGWELGMIRGSRKRTGEELSKLNSASGERVEDEVDIEDLEEGEDAPIIVDM